MSDVREIMPRVSRVLPHLSVEEVQQKIKTAINFRRQQKWLIVYNALVDPREAAQIALHTGTTKRTVHQVISDYNRSWYRSDRDFRKGSLVFKASSTKLGHSCLNFSCSSKSASG